MEIKQCQKELLPILLEFRRVCEALGLRYYLTAGTLLGAVRHRGFIPWDDDIDVAMPREDYDRFSVEAPAILNRGYIFQDYRTEPNFPYDFAKLRRTDISVSEPLLRCIHMEQGLYLDIFPLDQCPDSERLAILFFKGVELLDCAVLGRVCGEFSCGYRKWYMIFLWKVFKRLSNHRLFSLRDRLRRRMARWSSGKRLCTVGGNHGYPRETYQAQWFAETVTLEFEGERFPAPKHWDSLLRNMYGDYRNPPDPSERTAHFVQP